MKIIQTIIHYVIYYFPDYYDENDNVCFILSCLVYRYLYRKYFGKSLDMNIIKYRLNNGLIDLLFQTNSNVLKK